MKRLVVGLALLLILSSTSIAANSDANQCARLFTDPAELQTCESLRGVEDKTLSDAEMRELVSKQLYGVSAAEAAANRKTADEERRRAAEELEEERRKSPCGHIYPRGFDRSVCIWSNGLHPTGETEEELRASVERILSSMKANSDYRDSVTAAIQDSEKQDIDDYMLQRKEEKRLAAEHRRAQEKARKKALVASRAAKRIDSQLKRGTVGFVLRKTSLKGFGVVLGAQFTLQNNTASLKKDFVIECTTTGESGTQLNVVRNTLYQALKPRERRTFSLDVGFVNAQSARASCNVVGWR